LSATTSSIAGQTSWWPITRRIEDIQIDKELTLRTPTATGLAIDVGINEGQYETKRRVEEKFKDNINSYVRFSDMMPQWNYSFICKPLGVIF
jgi:hypothetical protein